MPRGLQVREGQTVSVKWAERANPDARQGPRAPGQRPLVGCREAGHSQPLDPLPPQARPDHTLPEAVGSQPAFQAKPFCTSMELHMFIFITKYLLNLKRKM